MKQVRVTNTERFVVMSKEAAANRRNRRPAKKLLERLDLDGVHVVELEMVHNDEEIRCLWLCKVEGQDKPVKVWMDNGFKAIEKNTEMVEASGGG